MERTELTRSSKSRHWEAAELWRGLDWLLQSILASWEEGEGRRKKGEGGRGRGREEERVPPSSVWGEEASPVSGQQPDPEGRHSSEGGR